MPGKIRSADTIMSLLKENLKQFETPVATEIGSRTRSPFMVLVSCLLSLRTNDKVTGPVSRRLFGMADTPERISRMKLEELEAVIRPVNYYKTKARRIKDISRTLLEQHGGKVPESFEGLMELKGVGRKTANIVMVYGHMRSGYIPVDTHCHRIPNRLGWVRTKTPEQTESELKKALPRKHWKDFNDLFVTFGQNICKPIGPLCSTCPISRYCKYYKEVYVTAKSGEGRQSSGGS